MSELSERGRAYAHPCPYCTSFSVMEQAPQIVTTWRDDGAMTVKITRVAWELPMIDHWFADHPEYFRMVFPGVTLVSDARLATAARAQNQLNDQLAAALLPIYNSARQGR